MPEALTTSTTSETLTGGKYLTFVLGRESYGIQVLKVREIIRLTDITAVPQMPDCVRGVINLRGKIIPVIDLRVRFGLTAVDPTERTCIVVVRIASSSGCGDQVGLIVDAVEEVLHIPSADIEPTPDFAGACDTGYLLGMARVKGAVKCLLDVDRVVGLASAPEEIETA